MCETYGLAKEGARHHGYTGQRGYHPLLAIAAGTGEASLMNSAARGAGANTVRGAAHFLRETVGRVLPELGHRGQPPRCGPTAASMPTPVVVVCQSRWMSASPSHHPPTRPSSGSMIEAMSRGGLDARPLLDGRRRRSWPRPPEHSLYGRARSRPSAAHRPAGEAHARFPDWPSSPATAITASSPTGTGKPLAVDLECPTIAATPRRVMPSEIRQARRRPQVPSPL